MKSTFYYITFIAFTIFAFWVAFTWDIPVNNQMGMAFMGIMCFSLLVLLIIEDVKESHREQPYDTDHTNGRYKGNRYYNNERILQVILGNIR